MYSRTIPVSLVHATCPIPYRSFLFEHPSSQFGLILCFVDLRTCIISLKSQLGAQFFLVCLFLFCTCFRRLCAFHQER